jgi:lipopolysaccharide/colanic/teichoic acid biosynthesis glycosyltransferase
LYPKLKRPFDILSAVILLILAAPLMVLSAAAVRLTMGRPVLFRQVRPGLNERLFTCFKFRTMNEARDQKGRLLSEEQRLTRLGLLLRRTSLDELPQLWNILRGDLSVVGPRPLLERYLPYYTSEERRRHCVRPGLTGWAQIHGRNCVPFDKRLEMDVWYIDHLSFWLDLRILVVTAWIVLRQHGFRADAAALDELRREISANCRDSTAMTHGLLSSRPSHLNPNQSQE